MSHTIAPFFIFFREYSLVARRGSAEWSPRSSSACRDTQSILRDWVPLGFTLAAYREMNWFTPRFEIII